jgi:hypothetical protein
MKSSPLCQGLPLQRVTFGLAAERMELPGNSFHTLRRFPGTTCNFVGDHRDGKEQARERGN